MNNFLGTLFNLQVLGGIVITAIIIFVLAKFLAKKNENVKTILKVLEYADELINFFMPEKYKEVYQALIAAVKRVTDGAFTNDEALITAREVFAQVLKELKVTLTDEEKAFVDKILVFVVSMIVKDNAASAIAVSSVCAVKGFEF